MALTVFWKATARIRDGKARFRFAACVGRGGKVIGPLNLRVTGKVYWPSQKLPTNSAEAKLKSRNYFEIPIGKGGRRAVPATKGAASFFNGRVGFGQLQAQEAVPPNTVKPGIRRHRQLTLTMRPPCLQLALDLLIWREEARILSIRACGESLPPPIDGNALCFTKRSWVPVELRCSQQDATLRDSRFARRAYTSA